LEALLIDDVLAYLVKQAHALSDLDTLLAKVDLVPTRAEIGASLYNCAAVAEASQPKGGGWSSDATAGYENL
jgi:hypothetical protein